MTNSWMRKLFSHYGEVLDVFISMKKRRQQTATFGFIHYGKRSEALKAMEKVNGMVIRGDSILIKEAKYKRSSGPIVKAKIAQSMTNMKNDVVKTG